MRRILLLVVMIGILSCDSDPHPGYSCLLTEGVFYKVLRFDEEGVRVTHGDMVEFALFLESDTAMKVQDIEFQKIVCDTSAQGLKSDLIRFHQGDSLSILMEKQAFDREFYGKIHREEGELERLILMVKAVIPKDRWEQSKQMDHAAHLEYESASIKSYIASRPDSAAFRWKAGMLWRNVEIGHGGAFQGGEELMVMFKARLLDGTQVDDRWEIDRAMAYQIGMQGQLIEGLERAVAHMDRGDVLELIIPSELAFGERGAANGLIPPWSTLIFDLKVHPRPLP